MNCEHGLIKSWYVNGFEIRLFGNEDYLTYETFDTATKEVIDKGSFEEEQKTLKKTPEEMVACLEKCRVVLNENNKALFSRNIAEWDLGNKKVYLLEGKKDLVWDIFDNITKTSTFFSFIKSTIPSSRSHLEIISHLKTIKEECQNDTSPADILMENFKVVRLLDKDSHTKELSQLSERIAEINKYSPILGICFGLGAGAITGSVSYAFSASFINAAQASISSFFGSGVIATIATVYTKLGLSIAAFSLGAIIPLTFFTLYALGKLYDGDTEAKTLQRMVSERNLQEPLLIEIEPKLTPPPAIK